LTIYNFDYQSLLFLDSLLGQIRSFYPFPVFCGVMVCTS